ncbi:hypothetical protein [Streptomyces sp. NPDC047042]|uniref:hypothetical protein n=1 Tax=Streptomyces sp. NPDC047042 TaxID=3154807 RepID=UPI0033ED731B
MTDIDNRDGKRPQTAEPEGGRHVGGAPAVPPSPPTPPPAASSASSGAPAPVRAPEGGTSHRTGTGTALLAQDERDKLTLRLQHAVTGFVDGPQESVEEADRVLEEVTERLTEAVARSRRTVRATLQSSDGKDTGDTERLRLALRDYRELAERLLHS